MLYSVDRAHKTLVLNNPNLLVTFRCSLDSNACLCVYMCMCAYMRACVSVSVYLNNLAVTLRWYVRKAIIEIISDFKKFVYTNRAVRSLAVCCQTLLADGGIVQRKWMVFDSSLTGPLFQYFSHCWTRYLNSVVCLHPYCLLLVCTVWLSRHSKFGPTSVYFLPSTICSWTRRKYQACTKGETHIGRVSQRKRSNEVNNTIIKKRTCEVVVEHSAFDESKR